MVVSDRRARYPISPPGHVRLHWQLYTHCLLAAASTTAITHRDCPTFNELAQKSMSNSKLKNSTDSNKPAVELSHCVTRLTPHKILQCTPHSNLVGHSAFTSAGRGLLVGVVLHPGSPSWKAETIDTAIGSVGPNERERCPLAGCTQSTPQKSLSTLGFFKRSQVKP